MAGAKPGGDNQENIMDSSGNVELILVRMEGKIDRMGDRMGRYEQDVTGVRQRLHDLANDITPLVMLDLPGRIRVTDTWRAEHEQRLKALENTEQQRKGAAALAKILWAILGGIIVAAVSILIKFWAGV